MPLDKLVHSGLFFSAGALLGQGWLAPRGTVWALSLGLWVWRIMAVESVESGSETLYLRAMNKKCLAPQGNCRAHGSISPISRATQAGSW